MQSDAEDKLKRVMEKSGLFDPATGSDSSGSDWSPVYMSKEAKIISKAGETSKLNEKTSHQENTSAFPKQNVDSGLKLLRAKTSSATNKKTKSLNKVTLKTKDRVIVLNKKLVTKKIQRNKILTEYIPQPSSSKTYNDRGYKILNSSIKLKPDQVSSEDRESVQSINESHLVENSLVLELESTNSSTRSESILQNPFNQSVLFENTSDIPLVASDPKRNLQEQNSGSENVNPESGLLEPSQIIKIPLQDNWQLIDPATGFLESSQITKTKSHEMVDFECNDFNNLVGRELETFENNSTSLKRKLINPETGALEDVLDVPKVLGPALSKRKLLNPETGVIEEVDDTDTEHVEKNIKGKKKKKTPKLWTRNKNKAEKLKDHTRREIPNCRCKCNTKINNIEAQKVFEKFINLSTHTEQNIYLQGCIKEEMAKRFRPRNKYARPRRLFSYMLNFGNKSVTLCASAFLAIHGIKRERLKKKVLQKHKDIEDGRGKHNNHPKSITKETIDKVHNFISSLPTQASHYSRTDNKHRKYVPASLSIAKLHRQFLTIYPDLKNILKYEKFREIFNHDFNISFGSPRKDICNVCEKYIVDIKSAELAKDEDKAKQLKVEKELHLRKAETFFDKLKFSETNTDDHVISICFDYQKNLPLPVTNVQDEYYRRQLWLHNFGIHNIKEGTATMYLYTENYAHKGPNEVITALNDYIKYSKNPIHTKLNIYCDNCFSQNKNKYLFAFLDQLCNQGIFENVSIIYPIPGHSMMPIDRDFAQIEKRRIREQTIYTPEYYVDLIKTCRLNKPFDIVFMERNLRKNEDGDERTVKVKDYKKLYDDYVKPVPGISACREVKFSKLNRPSQRSTMTGPFKPFTFYRVGVPRHIRSEPENTYNAPLMLKPGKIKDIKHLLKFVDEEERYFYSDILNIDENTVPSEIEDFNSEDDKE